MKLLERTDNEPDRRFKTGISPELREEFFARIAEELRAASHPEKTYLIDETVALTMRLNELKNRMRNGDHGSVTRHELMHATSALARILKEMGIATDDSSFPSSTFSADLVCVTRQWIVSEMANADARQFYQC